MRHSLFASFVICSLALIVLAPGWSALPALTVKAEPDQPQANTYIVSGTSDPAPSACTITIGGYSCPSLRSAVIAANANPGSTIRLTHGAAYNLTIASSGTDDATTGDLNITVDTSFDFGNVICSINCGAAVQGGAGWLDRIMRVESGAHVSMFGVTFRNGNTQDPGGAILIYSNAALTLTSSTVTGNFAYAEGGGIANSGRLYLSNSSVSTNTVGFDGGGLYNSGTATVLFSTVSNNSTGNSNGGGIENYSGVLTVLTSTISNNTAADKGGSLYNLGTVVMTDTQVTGSKALSGGGVFQSAGNTTLNNVILDANTASGSGGNVLNQNFSTVTLVNSTVQNGKANYGAGLSNDAGGTINLNNTKVMTNYSTSNGGGIWNGSVVALNNGTLLQNNSASGNGGGLINYGVATIDHSTLLKNTTECDTGSHGYGGGIYNVNQIVLNTSVITASYACEGGGLYNFGTISGQDNTIAYNRGYYDAGGVYVNQLGTMTLNGGTIFSNTTSYGGAGLLNQGTVTLNNVDVARNNGAHYGGGVENFGTLSMNGGAVMSNTVDDSGGGVYNQSTGKLTLVNVAFLSNTIVSGSNGGGLFAAGIVNATGLLFSGNQATDNGGAILAAGTLTLTNSTLSGNSATQGGGLQNDGTTWLNNVTIAGNTNYGLYSGYTLHLANSIIAGNSGGDCNGMLTSHGYNLIQSTTNCTITGTTTGNQPGTNPQLGPLQDNGGPTWTRALLNGSPAINAANPATPDGLAYHCLATDQRGATRMNRCDIGAFEAGGLTNHVLLPIVIR
jgi:predicted outer membrane repeat protein